MTISLLGCGWFGLALAKSLIADGNIVKGSTTSADKLPILANAGINPYLIDLATGAQTHDFFDCEVLVIAIPPKSRSGEGDEYVPKLQHAIDTIKNAAVKKVILISSTGVYADQNRIVNELSDPQPNTASGKILLTAEEMFRVQEDFKTTVIRFGGLIGEGREPGRFFAGKKDVPNGLAPVNMIELNDCIGIARTVIDKEAFGYTFNACTPHHPTKTEFYTAASVKAGLPAPQFVPELDEWKIIESVTIPSILGYSYRIENWDEWLK